jgi:hypothetical protein
MVVPPRTQEYEADLYKVPMPRSFRIPKGELESKEYPDGNRRLEIEFYGAGIPDGASASVVIDGRPVCEVEVYRRHGKLKLSSAEGATLPDVGNGSVGEIQYRGQPLLRGVFRPD